MQQEEAVVHPYELRAQASKVLLKRLYRDLTSLVTEEIELAKVEMHQRAGSAVAALRGLGFAAACATVGLASLACGAIVALAGVLTLWLAALVVGGALVVVALVVATASRRALAALSEPLTSKFGAFVGQPTDASPSELRSRIELSRRSVDETLSALEHKTDLVAPIRDTALGLGSLGVAVSSIVRSDR